MKVGVGVKVVKEGGVGEEDGVVVKVGDIVEVKVGAEVVVVV